MHYKNGREVKNGDVAVNLQTSKVGVVYDTIAGTKLCSLRIASLSPNDEYITTDQCLHLDDVAKATIPDSTVASA